MTKQSVKFFVGFCGACALVLGGLSIASLSTKPALDESSPRVSIGKVVDHVEFQQKADIQAISKYLAKKYRQPLPSVKTIVQTAFKEATKQALPPLLVLAIIEQESSLKPTAYSGYGAMGLMQVVPRFHREKLKNPNDHSELLTTKGNIRVGTLVVAEYLRSTKGNVPRALKKYSGDATSYYEKVNSHRTKLARARDLARATMQAKAEDRASTVG